jgi:hypothetical protein
MPSREVLICLCVDAAVIPPAPSFNCQCELCGSHIWVPHNSPSNPRACVGLRHRSGGRDSYAASFGEEIGQRLFSSMV